MALRVLVLGGYGNFGGRIARRLARDPAFHVIVAGRDAAHAQAFCEEARAHGAVATIEACVLDVHRADWVRALDALRPQLVIDTCGPFQHRDHAVAEAIVGRGIHYLDLADSRDYVTGFAAPLDALARARGVLAVTGASTLPGVSAAVVDALRPAFARIESIDCGISPGNRDAPGTATIAAILAYVGKPFRQWRGGQWQRAHGWQRLRPHGFPAPMGRRWLGDCDVPDLELFPARYGAAGVRFGAGIELPLLHIALWMLSWLVRVGLVRDASAHVGPLARAFGWFRARGTSVGGMHVTLRGTDGAGRPHSLTWSVVATGGDGPEIPCTPAVLIARKLARDERVPVGARPCVDLFTLDEFRAEIAAFRIAEFTQAGADRPRASPGT